MKSFLLGAVGYPLLELCWRGRTHPTMSLAGGISCWGLDRLRRSRLPAWSMPLVGCGIITGVEAAVGLLCHQETGEGKGDGHAASVGRPGIHHPF